MSSKQMRIPTGRFAFFILSTLAGTVYLGSRKTETHAQNQVPQHARVSAIDDWSHRHVVYSTPSSLAQSLKLQSEPRYQLQLQKRHATPPQSDVIPK
jgi:hypothetical protein